MTSSRQETPAIIYSEPDNEYTQMASHYICLKNVSVKKSF